MFKFFIVFFTFVSSNVMAKKLSLWELGIGVLNLRINHYRGSDQYEEIVLPYPYFVYRGEKFKADNAFIQGRFLKYKQMSVMLSLVPGLKVNNKKNNARRGMQDIDNTLEIGPLFKFHLWHDKNKNNFLNFYIPIRAALATDFTFIRHVGNIAVPYLNFKTRAKEKTLGWSFDFSIAPMFATKKYHNYYYGVQGAYATKERPQYKAEGGFNGTQFTLIMSKKWKSLIFYPFIRYDTLKQAVFEDSPLVKRKNYQAFGMAISWMFLQSEKIQTGEAIR